MSARLEKGRTIAGRYRLERRLGRGGMGDVWRARHQVTGRRYALKFVRGAQDVSAPRRRRFFREARAAGLVDHPNVVQVFDAFTLDDGLPVMVMELVEGETLATMLAREETIELTAAADILAQIVSGVGAAHERGIVHRDLKPANVIVDDEGKVKVLDFGIAKLTAGDEEALTQTGHAMGTPAYMSPEQCRSEASVDHRADIWAIGVMLYEMVAGRRPLSGSSVGAVVEELVSNGIEPLQLVVSDMPFDLAVIAGKMLQADREARPTDLREVAEVLAKHSTVQPPSFGAVGSRPIEVSPEDEESALEDESPAASDQLTLEPSHSTQDEAPSPTRSRSWVLGVAAAAVIGVIALATSGDWQDPSGAGSEEREANDADTAMPASDTTDDAPATSAAPSTASTVADTAATTASAASTAPLPDEKPATVPLRPPPQRPWVEPKAPPSPPTASVTSTPDKPGITEKAPF